MSLRQLHSPTVSTRRRTGIIAVYDFGGGTFDISILKLHGASFEGHRHDGDTHLGGDRHRQLLITIAVDDIAGDMKLDLRANSEAVQAIRKAVIDAKIVLSHSRR